MSTAAPTIRTLSDALVLLHGASPADVVWAANALLAARQAKQPVDANDAVAAADAARAAHLAAKPAAGLSQWPAEQKKPTPAKKPTTPRQTPVGPPRPVALPASLPAAKPTAKVVNKAALAKLQRDVAGRLRFALSAGAKNAVLRLPSQAAVAAFDMAKANGGTEAAIQAAVAACITVA